MDLNKNIEDFDLVFLDVETTGLDAVEGDAICEIGACKVRARRTIETFESLVNPKKSIPPEAYLIHKISDADLKDAPYFEEIIDKLTAFLDNSVVCAYNAEFDIGFINHESRRRELPALELPAIDILCMARKTLKLPKYRLEYIADFFSIAHQKSLHRALHDARVASEVFFKLRDILKEKKVDALAEYVSLFGINNSVFRSKEEPKVNALKGAIAKGAVVKIRYFSYRSCVQEEEVKPLNFFQENKNFYLWYQDAKEQGLRININRIFNIEIV
jgi:DNA polymerase III epsilon subunit family exonuclease